MYWDLYLLVNLALNAALLRGTAALAGRRADGPAILRGAALGTVYAMGYPLIDLRPLYGVAGTILVALGMLWATFRPLRLRDGALLFPLLVLAAAGGGLGLALGRDAFGRAGGGGPTALQLVAIAGFVLLAAGAVRRWGERNGRMRHLLAEVTVWIDGRTATFTGLVDTGNCVVHPLTGEPVMIVERDAIRNILPEDWRRLADELADGMGCAGPRARDSAARRFCLIPLRSLQGGEVLPGLRVDRLHLDASPGSPHRDAVLAVTRERVSGEGRYRALIPPELPEG